MRPLAPLPTDTSNFGALRTAGQVYIDKTAYIQRMLADKTRYAFLARPRRFGKSLLISTLAHLFDRENDDLFQGLAIAESGFLAEVPRAPVLRLDMSGTGSFDPEVDIKHSFRRVVGVQCRLHGLRVPARDTTHWEALEDAILDLRERHGQNVVVLVDEYDAPLTDMWSSEQTPSASRQRHVLDHLRLFYRVLKRMDECLTFVFLTGILRIEGAGLFSALNNLENLSGLASYSGLCGFTEAEIDRCLAPHLARAAAHCRQSRASMQAVLRRHYNGYRFAATGEPVYNPISYLTALRQLTRTEDAREIQVTELPRPWLDLGQTQFLFRHMEDQGATLRDLDFNAAGAQSSFDWRRPSLNALLYQTGFLTLITNEAGQVGLDFPNWEVEVALQEGMFYTYLGRLIGKDSPERTLIRRMTAALQAGDCAGVLDAFDQMLNRVSYAELAAESNYQIALHLACAMCQSLLRVEAEVLGRRGRADIVAETRDTFYVFELKLNKSVAEALQQIKDRGYLDKYAAEGKRAVGVGVNFAAPADKRAADAREGSKKNYAWDTLPGPGTRLTKQERPAQASSGPSSGQTAKPQVKDGARSHPTP